MDYRRDFPTLNSAKCLMSAGGARMVHFLLFSFSFFVLGVLLCTFGGVKETADYMGYLYM